MRVLNLQHLLDAFVERMDRDRNRVAMTRTAVRHTVKAFGVGSPSEIRISAFEQAPDVLEHYLKERGSSAMKVRNNKSFLKRLIEWGQEMSLVPTETYHGISEPWQSVIEACRDCFPQGAHGWDALAGWASSRGLEPSDLTSADFLEFGRWLEFSRSFKYWRNAYNYVRRAWIKASLEGKLPRVDIPLIPYKASPYCLPVEEWPRGMQEEYKRYRNWATADFMPGRRKRNKQRPISAKRTLSTLERIAGYVVNVRGGQKEQLKFDMFFDKDLVTEFLAWLSSERKIRETTMFCDVILLLSMGLRYRKLDERELLWLSQLKDQLEDARPRDKSWKMVPLEDLRSIPDRLRKERLELERRMKFRRNRPSLATWARAVRNELIFELITARPLRSRNIREARIGRNIFKTSDGRWRLLFEGDETKVGNTLSFFVPQSLEPSLRLYLEKARPILTEGNGSDILFVSDTGKPLTGGALKEVVKTRCMKYLGRPVTPHVIRDIVAHAILSKNPEDYLKVSKLLGHKRVETTLRIYGHYEMDEAARSYEEILESDSSTNEDGKKLRQDSQWASAPPDIKERSGKSG